MSGNNTYNSPAPQFVPTAPGNYHWVAVYSGNPPNTNGLTHNAACTDTNEDVTVNTVNSTMATAQSWVPNDSATISAPAGGALAGSVSFALYASSDCAVGGDAAIYSVTEAGLRCVAPDGVHGERHRSAGHGILLVVGELHQHQLRPGGHPGQLPRDLGTDRHQRRDGEQPVILT